MEEIDEYQHLCLECLFCCSKIGIPTRFPIRKEIVEWLEIRGFKVKTTPDGFLDIWHDSFPCPSLTSGGCSIYPSRPDVCKSYDGRNSLGEKCKWTRLGDTELKTSWYHNFMKED